MVFSNLIKECFNEGIGVEFGDVCGFLTEADEFYRYIKLVFDGDNDSAASGAVELGQEYPRNVYRFGEHLCLSDCVLACRGIENEQHLIGRAGYFSGYDVADFCQLPHQVRLRMQSPGCVENQDVGGSCCGGLTGIERHCCGVAAGFVLYDLYAYSLGPDTQLLYGGGTKCVAGGNDDILVVLAQYVSQLGDARGFAGAVDAGDQNYGWAGFSKM